MSMPTMSSSVLHTVSPSYRNSYTDTTVHCIVRVTLKVP